MMTDFLRHLPTVPSRRHGSDDITDEKYDRQLRDLTAYLKQPGLAPTTTDLKKCLDTISPSVHTLSFLYLLHFQIQYAQENTKCDIPDDLLPGGILWKQAAKFLKTFDPIQIRYAGHEWRRLVELVASAAQAASKPSLAVRVIRDALDRLDPSSGTFTSVHLIFVKLALLSSSYTAAVPIMGRLICHFPTESERIHDKYYLCSEHESSATFITDESGFSAKLTYQDYLQFFLYSAMIYMALKKWLQASHYLSAVISSPTTNCVSKIMVEAYKKWILTSLLECGKLSPPSRMIAPHVTRVYQSLARPYLSLAEAFEKGDLQRLNAEINLGQSIWRTDNNVGLVSQLPEAFDKYTIIKLGKTFSALTIADVLQRKPSCSRDTTQDIEAVVASLVMSSALKATLSHQSNPGKPTMMRFPLSMQCHAIQEEYVSSRLIQGKSALDTIAQRIRQSNHSLELSPENLQFMARNQKWAGNSEKAGVASSGEAGGGFDVDEDLMGDSQ